MSETIPYTSQNPDLLTTQETLQVRFNSFEEAQSTSRPFSDEFIDTFTDNPNSTMGIKGYLDEVIPTDRDTEIIDDPERVANLYVQTTEMIARNLKVKVDQNKTDRPVEEVKQNGEEMLQKLWGYRINTPIGLKSLHKSANNPHAEKNDKILDKETEAGLEYKGINFNQPGVRANFDIQRQTAGTFIMGYSDRRVQDKLSDTSNQLDKRIYLNPDMEATPQLFEQLLQAANQAGISIQLKMFQRATEAVSVHVKSTKGQAISMRGDGIVIYTDDEDANDTLEMVLALAKDNPDAFIGRSHSRVPQYVAEGIAIGDEPTQVAGESLTSHREKMLSDVAQHVMQSGAKGEDARTMFRELWERSSELNGVDPNNLAFNKAA